MRTDEAQFFFDVGKDMAERQGAQIARMARTILIYREAIDKLACDVHLDEIVDDLIAEAERNLTTDDKERIG